MDAIKYVQQELHKKVDFPSFRPGDTVEVSYKIIEGGKERIQKFRGVVIKINGHGDAKNFTVRKVSNNIGVERIFPMFSPNIDGIQVMKAGKVRRSKLYYIRELSGKKARIKEKQQNR